MDMEAAGGLSSAFDSSLAAYGLIAIFVVMLVKQVGLPLPIPSDIVAITAGVQAAQGSFTPVEVMLAIEAAVIIGGTAQFFLVRGVGRRLLLRGGHFIGLTPERLETATARLKRRGALAVFIGHNIPGARAAVIPAAALAGLPYAPVAIATLAGTTIFYAWHVALGYVAGPSAAGLLERFQLPLWPLVLGLAVLGLAGWLVLHRCHKAAPAPAASVADRVRSWTEAACPGCVAAAAVQRAAEKLSAAPGEAAQEGRP